MADNQPGNYKEFIEKYFTLRSLGDTAERVGTRNVIREGELLSMAKAALDDTNLSDEAKQITFDGIRNDESPARYDKLYRVLASNHARDSRKLKGSLDRNLEAIVGSIPDELRDTLLYTVEPDQESRGYGDAVDLQKQLIQRKTVLGKYEKGDMTAEERKQIKDIFRSDAARAYAQDYKDDPETLQLLIDLAGFGDIGAALYSLSTAKIEKEFKAKAREPGKYMATVYSRDRLKKVVEGSAERAYRQATQTAQAA